MDYTFHEFLVDREILKDDMGLDDERVMWSVYGDDYIDFCEENDYDACELFMLEDNY